MGSLFKEHDLGVLGQTPGPRRHRQSEVSYPLQSYFEKMLVATIAPNMIPNTIPRHGVAVNGHDPLAQPTSFAQKKPAPPPRQTIPMNCK